MTDQVTEFVSSISKEFTSSSEPEAPDDLNLLDEAFKVDQKVIDFATCLAEHDKTFLDFPPDQSGVPFEFTDQHNLHARLLLESSEPFAQLRYRVCPGKMPELEFWRVYFTLLRNLQNRRAPPAVTSSSSSSSRGVPPQTDQKKSIVGASSPPPLPDSAAVVDFDEIDSLCDRWQQGVVTPTPWRASEQDLDDSTLFYEVPAPAAAAAGAIEHTPVVTHSPLTEYRAPTTNPFHPDVESDQEDQAELFDRARARIPRFSASLHDSQTVDVDGTSVVEEALP